MPIVLISRRGKSTERIVIAVRVPGWMAKSKAPATLSLSRSA